MMSSLIARLSWRSAAGAGAALVATNDDSPDSSKTTPRRIAVVGAGIGGTSCCKFLRELMPDVHIDLFNDSDRVGGRLRTRPMPVYDGKDEIDFEIGGSVIHKSNRYMVALRKEARLETVKPRLETATSLVDGLEETVPIRLSSWKSISTIQLLWRYGYDLVRLRRFVKDTITKFCQIYDLQSGGQCYESAQQLFAACDLTPLARESLRETLTKRGFGDEFINELAQAAARVNYGQTVDQLHGLVGAVSLAGAQDSKLWHVDGGNWRICEYLAKHNATRLFQEAMVIAFS